MTVRIQPDEDRPAGTDTAPDTADPSTPSTPDTPAKPSTAAATGTSTDAPTPPREAPRTHRRPEPNGDHRPEPHPNHRPATPQTAPHDNHPAAAGPQPRDNHPADHRTRPHESPGTGTPARVDVPVRAAGAPPAAGAPHPLRTESLRGFTPWAAAALLLALGWPLAATAAQWQGSWGGTTDRLSTAAGLIAVPFGLAAGAWQGGRERRRRMTELRAASPRTPLAQFLTAALPLACALAAAYLVVVAGALLACAPYVSAGGPVPAVFAGDALSIAACTVLGQVAGRVMPWRLTAPALAICGYVLAAGGVGSSGLTHLAPASLHLVGDGDLPVWWYPLVSALWTAGLAAAAVLARSARRRVTALLPLAAASAAAVLLVHTGDGMLRDNPLAHRQVCDDSTTPHVCVNATRPDLLPEAVRVLSGVTSRLKGVQNVPVRFEDLPRRPREDEAELPMLTPLGWWSVRGKVNDPEQYARQGAVNLVRRECEEAPSARRVQVTDGAVLRWLAPDSAGKDDRERAVASARERGDTKELATLRAEDRAYARLAALTDDERRSWLGRYFATAHACDPDANEVPSL
ncbi:hypothetical protein ACIA7S_07635 [Streptomyces sp. NPDC051643]|uniref:hypothetical protein n=1 Tax=Streptomyces sp. NPDC051643 TaxID=3365665 RepID=UPI0037A78616